jgi:hypothetical protein
MTKTVKLCAEAIQQPAGDGIFGVAGVTMKLFKGNQQLETKTTPQSGVVAFDEKVTPGTMNSYSVVADLGPGVSVRYAFRDTPTQNAERGPLFQKTRKAYVHKVTFHLKPRPSSLIVDIFHRPDPTKQSVPRPFKDLAIRVQSDRVAAMVAKDGVANFGVVPSGKHKITLTFVDANQNRFDFFGASECSIDLDLGQSETLSFEVEPLYQTVRFVAHCLVTIPKQIWQDDELQRDIEIDLPQGEFLQDVRDAQRKHIFESEDTALRSKYWKVQYTGLDGTPDIDRRVEVISSVITQAAAQFAEKDDELKIFMIPECFFLGRYGAYPVEDLATLVNKLQKLVMGPAWRHWMFVFGTVNTTFSDDQGRFLDFTNFSPVVRGGAGSDENSPSYARMIQKAKFCAELAGTTDLLPNAPVNTLTSEKVRFGFGGTENELILGRTMLEILADDEPPIEGKTIAKIFEDSGLTAVHWTELKKAVKAAVADPAITVTGIVRDVREYIDTHIDELAKLEFCGMLMPDKIFITLSWQQVVKAFLVTILRKTALWKKNANKGAIKTALEAAIVELGRPQELVHGLDFQLISLEARIREVILDVEQNDVASQRFAAIWDVKSADIQPKKELKLTWVPLFKKLLQRYLATRGLRVEHKILLGPPLSKNFSIDDYTFACWRKPGPFLDKEDAPAARKLTFGLEICADHSEGRLQGALTQAAVKPTFDIQLIPSAGMVIQEAKVVTRTNGLVFNCDGWNASGAMLSALDKRGGTKREENVAEWPKEGGKNPLRPHSEVVKKAGNGVVPVLPEKKIVIGDDVATVFPVDAGELHIYPPQDLT